MKYFRNILFNSATHNDWYICESDYHSTKVRTVRQKIKIILDFYNGDPDVLERCTFLLHPLREGEDKFKNCKGVIAPDVQNMINGQPLQKLPALLPPPQPAPVLPVCIPTCTAPAVPAAVSTKLSISKRKLII